jgi:hypothetical protein
MALVVDRERANASSVSPEVIAGLVGYALRGSSLPKFNYEGREIPVRIRFQEKDRESLADLSAFQIPVEGGGVIPLSALTHPKMLNTPKQIFRWNKRISRTLTVELKKEGAKEARDQLAALQRQFSLPEGVSFSQSRVMTMDEELANMLFAAELSVLFHLFAHGIPFRKFYFTAVNYPDDSAGWIGRGVGSLSHWQRHRFSWNRRRHSPGGRCREQRNCPYRLRHPASRRGDGTHSRIAHGVNEALPSDRHDRAHDNYWHDSPNVF